MALGTQTPTERPTTERERIVAIEAVLPHLATKADVADVKVYIERMQANMIKWHIGTAIAIIGAVFAIVRFLG